MSSFSTQAVLETEVKPFALHSTGRTSSVVILLFLHIHLEFENGVERRPYFLGGWLQSCEKAVGHAVYNTAVLCGNGCD